LARELHRPVLLLAEDGELATGSGRSIADVPLHGFLEPWREHYERFGGHDAAIGMTVRTERLVRLRPAWEAAAVWPPEVLERRYRYELELRAGQVTPELHERLRALEPHGPENPAPLLRVGPLRLKLAPTVFGEQHLKARAVGPDGESVWLLGWRFWNRRSELEGGDFEVLGHLEWDPFLEQPLVSLVDIRAAT
jgi:single-stranded-DNA-specific exonuclease